MKIHECLLMSGQQRKYRHGFAESSGLLRSLHVVSSTDRRRTFLTSPVVSVPAHLDHPHLLPITHLLALPISQPLLYIYIYIYTSILRWFHPHLFIASQLDFCQLPAWCCLLLSVWPRDIFSSELRLTSCVFLWVSSAQKTSTAIFHSCCALL